MYFAVRLYWRCRSRWRFGFELENTDHWISLLRTNEFDFEFYIVINIKIICFDFELTKETMNDMVVNFLNIHILTRSGANVCKMAFNIRDLLYSEYENIVIF